jgi:hypothetical protein
MRVSQAAIVAIAIAALTCTPARAQTNEQVELQVVPQPYLERDFGREAAITIRAVWPLECSVVFSEASARVDLVASTQRDVGVQLNCNTPFRLRATAENGMLQHIGQYRPGDARSFLPYAVTWPAMVSNGGFKIAQNFSADGRQWAQGLEFRSGTSVINQTGEMRITWGNAQNLLAGEYREVFILEMEPVE